ncbi:hypothetical protein CsSME_00015489 [Camellia sinensis var. sinensis]
MMLIQETSLWPEDKLGYMEVDADESAGGFILSKTLVFKGDFNEIKSIGKRKGCEDGRDWGTKPFRFINAWVSHPSFMKIVKQVWNDTQVEGWAGFRLMVKLRSLKQALKIWNVEVFGHVESKLKAAEDELHAWDLTT